MSRALNRFELFIMKGGHEWDAPHRMHRYAPLRPWPMKDFSGDLHVSQSSSSSYTFLMTVNPSAISTQGCLMLMSKCHFPAAAGTAAPPTVKGESQDFNKKRARTSFRLSTTTAPSGLISFAAILA